MFKWWRKRQRRIDLDILWPTCKRLAPDLDHAKAAFMFHAVNDKAWTKDFNHKELAEYVGDLF